MAAVLPLPDERDRSIRGKRRDAPDPKLEGPPLKVEEQPDGGALVSEEEPEVESTTFGQNLAEVIDETDLQALARDLLEKIELDKTARRRRDEQYEEGLRRTGLGDDAPGGASFAGASKATHPMLTEASVDFAASMMRELYPPSGPVKSEIKATMGKEQLELSERQVKYMNWQLTEQIEEYPEELEVTMTQLPMGGSQFMKLWNDRTERRPVTEFVPVDDILVPYGCNSFWTSHRITHVQRLTEGDFDERVESEMYRDLELSAPPDTPEPTRAQAASEKIEGVEQPGRNVDGLRYVYESNTFCKLKVDKGERRPYLISIDERTNRVLSVYRNWEEDDKKRIRLHWIVDYGFIPWRGALKLGLPQMIGGLSAAATGALRALLDSALVQTIPVLAKLKGPKFGAQTKSIDPMTMIEIEAGPSLDDIRKAMMPLPFNAPSPVLFELLGWLTEAAKGVVTTAEEKISEAGNQMPVGTALALIEQGAKVMSSIHARMHRSQKKALKILARLNKTSLLSPEEQVEVFGEVLVTPEDFRKPLGVIPVSDPNVFSEGQRYAQMQMVLQLAQGVDPKTGQPTATGRLHNLYEVLKSSYKLAKIPDIDRILPPPKEPSELNAAAENAAVMLGQPVQAFPQQSHYAHIETHIRFVLDPLLGGNPAAVPSAWPAMIEHLKQHLAFLYAKEMHDTIASTLGEETLEAFMQDKGNWGNLDELLAAASRSVHDQLAKTLKPLGPQMLKIIQHIEQIKPPAPMDPSQASLQIAKMEDQRDRAKHGDEMQLSGAELQAKKDKDARDAAAKDEANRIKDEQVHLAHGVSLANTHIDGARASSEHDRHMRAHSLAMADHHERSSMERARFGHDQSMDHAGHELEAGAQAHSQELAADAQEHGQTMDVAQHNLAAGGQEHEQGVSREELDLNRQNQAHTQRMAEDGHDLEVSKHAVDVRQRETERVDSNKNAAEERKIKAAAAKAKPKNKPKGAK